MMKYFFKHLLTALIFVFAIVAFSWIGIEIGQFIGQAMGDEKYGFVVWIAFTVTLGVVYYAYSQAKIDIKYGSK